MAELPRICVGFYSPVNMTGIAPSTYDPNIVLPQQLMQAASRSNESRIWTCSSKTIKVFITDDSKQINATPIDQLKYNAKKTGITIDPLQFTILEDYKTMRERVQAVVEQRIQPLVGIKFVFLDSPKGSDVRVGFESNMATWSMIGRDCLRQPDSRNTMNLAWFDVGTVIHEFCHVLGMVHSENTPNGFDIDWKPSAVYGWANKTFGWSQSVTDKQILKKYSKGMMRGPGYDEKSIMKYFYPASFTKNNEIGMMNMSLSREDVEWLSTKYPGGAETPEQFYKTVYGQSYNAEPGISYIIKNHWFWIGILSAALIIMGILLIMKYRKK
jgi:hypothetical protein